MADLNWALSSLEPKRKFRYLISFGDNSGNLKDFQFLAQTCDRPGIKVGASEHKYFDKTFFHPGRVVWEPNPLSVKLVDIQKGGSNKNIDTNESLLKAFVSAGLSGLIAENGSVRTIGKQAAVNSLGLVTVKVLNSAVSTLPGETPAPLEAQETGEFTNGVAEVWTLRNAWLESIKPDALDYGSEDILTVTITLRYDWAEFNAGAAGDAVNPWNKSPQ